MPSKALRLLVFYLALLSLWQLVAYVAIWPSYVFPSPHAVLTSLQGTIDDGKLTEAVTNTMKRMAIGFGLSVVIGLLIGVAMGTFKWVDETLGSAVLGLQSLPSVTWFPIALLWFGLNDHAIIFVVLMGSVCSIAISSRTGVRDIPVIQLRAGRMFGANRLQMYWMVVMPAMLPSMVQGLKLGWSFAWRSLLAAELLFVSPSLGHLLGVGRDLNDVGLVMAMMFVIVAISMIVDRVLFGRLEHWVHDRWGLAQT